MVISAELFVLQSFPGLQNMGEEEDCLILVTVPLEVKLPSSLIVHLECSHLFFMPPEIRRELLDGPNGFTQPCRQRL